MLNKVKSVFFCFVLNYFLHTKSWSQRWGWKRSQVVQDHTTSFPPEEILQLWNIMCVTLQASVVHLTWQLQPRSSRLSWTTRCTHLQLSSALLCLWNTLLNMIEIIKILENLVVWDEMGHSLVIAGSVLIFIWFHIRQCNQTRPTMRNYIILQTATQGLLTWHLIKVHSHRNLRNVIENSTTANRKFLEAPCVIFIGKADLQV